MLPGTAQTGVVVGAREADADTDCNANGEGDGDADCETYPVALTEKVLLAAMPATHTWPTQFAVADANPHVAGLAPLLQLATPPLGAVRKPPGPLNVYVVGAPPLFCQYGSAMPLVAP